MSKEVSSYLCYYGAFAALLGIAALGVAAAGLNGTASFRAVNITGLVSGCLDPIFGIPQFIVSVLGMSGMISMHVVAGVTIAFSGLAAIIGIAMMSCASASRKTSS